MGFCSCVHEAKPSHCFRVHLVSSAASRKRTQRARQALGHAVVSVEIDEVNVTTFLIAAELLDPRMADDRNAIGAALGHFIALAVEADEDVSRVTA